MSAQALVYVVALGAAAIALWLDVRLAARTPRSATWTFFHLGGSMVALVVMPQLILFVVGGTEEPVRKLAATMLVVLPVLTYFWLSALWLLKLLQRAAQLRL